MRFPVTERTPKDARAEEKREVAVVLRRAHEATGISREANGAQTGAGPTLSKRWADPTENATITAVDVRRSFSELALPVLAWQVEPHAASPGALEIADKILDAHGKISVDKPKAEAQAATHLQHIHSLATELPDVLREYTAALSTHGGKITADERKRLRKEITEALRALCEADQALALEEAAEARGCA